MNQSTYRNQYSQLSITARIVILLLILIIPLDLLSLYVGTVMVRDSIASINDSVVATLDSYTEEVDRIVSNTEYTLYDVAVNKITYQDLFSGSGLDYQLARQQMWISLHDLLAGHRIPLADNLFFYNTEQDDLLSISNLYNTERDFLNSNRYLSDVSMQRLRWHYASSTGHEMLIRTYQKDHCIYGAIIYLDELMASISDYLKFPYQGIYYRKEDLPAGSDLVILKSACQNSDLHIYLTFRKRDIYASIGVRRWTGILMAATLLTAIVLLYIELRRWIVTPVSQLLHAQDQLSQGGEDYRIRVNTPTAEFTQVFDSFNRMADNLQYLQRENVRKETEKNRMLLDNLQLQIRPHFLLNSFNLLYALVQTRKTDCAEQMILYLSRYFRYLFKYSKDLELVSREMELVRDYLETFRIQSPGLFTFQEDFDPEVFLVRIPPLLLHNLVENIMSHALIPEQTIHITLTGYYMDGTVTFQVADDGRGMSEELVELINSGKYEQYRKGAHLGLQNTLARLAFFYQGKAQVTVQSSPGNGTIITIQLPYDLDETGEVDIYESADGE